MDELCVVGRSEEPLCLYLVFTDSESAHVSDPPLSRTCVHCLRSTYQHRGMGVYFVVLQNLFRLYKGHPR